MATLSSHVLDAERGDHAAGIGIRCYRLSADGRRETVFDVAADAQGRIREELEIGEGEGGFEVVFASGAYLDGLRKDGGGGSRRPVEEIVVRVRIDDPHKTCHIPVILSSHSCTVWWSH